MNNSNSPSFANCSLLVSRTDFASYVQDLNSTTAFNATLLEACKSDICNAIWGDGNADISGIGMVVGYFCASILGFLFALSLAFHEPLRRKSSTKHGKLLKDGYENFFECAIFFAASIQIACIIVLVRKDFGISANGLGGFTVQITWAVALLCMLPLLYPMVVLTYIDSEKNNYRLFLFCGCWLLFFYTFISQMIGNFGPTQIGTGAGGGGVTIITTDEWDTLTTLCLTGVKPLSNAEQRVLSGFGAAGSLLVTLYGLALILWFIGERLLPDHAETMKKRTTSFISKEQWRIYIITIVLVLVPTLTIPQFWGLLRLRGIQKALANATGNAYVDNQWTFGQVVAVMLFAPVATGMGFAKMKGGI
ncbi:uncharacterized protein PAC_07697 [Phialocephala subalpina]|uniref:Uncharacterized protein n=1 Tax=Phialocephala subalpina TaxID=576137 RepID=A0A1L7WYF6_9HELO|nr:uncharacterized protein PAC_07697 [Phialocephala subalpina]